MCARSEHQRLAEQHGRRYDLGVQLRRSAGPVEAQSGAPGAGRDSEIGAVLSQRGAGNDREGIGSVSSAIPADNAHPGIRTGPSETQRSLLIRLRRRAGNSVGRPVSNRRAHRFALYRPNSIDVGEPEVAEADSGANVPCTPASRHGQNGVWSAVRSIGDLAVWRADGSAVSHCRQARGRNLRIIGAGSVFVFEHFADFIVLLLLVLGGEIFAFRVTPGVDDL